jgi:hypothetical protein
MTLGFEAAGKVYHLPLSTAGAEGIDDAEYFQSSLLDKFYKCPYGMDKRYSYERSSKQCRVVFAYSEYS